LAVSVNSSCTVLAVGVIALASARVAAQRVPTITLKPADARLAEEFTRLAAVRELEDGRVILADGRDLRLMVADFRAGRVEQISRTGSGPNEYKALSQLWPIGRDSTLVPDANNRRWLFLVGARAAGTTPPDAPAVRTASGGLYGADQAGHVLVTNYDRRGSQDPTAGYGDSLLLLRVERSSGHADTIARLRPINAQMFITRDRAGQPTSVDVRLPPWAAGEQALMFDDGWIAVARLDPYRVEWRSADGRAVRGAALPFTPIRADDREKRAYMSGYASVTARPVRDPNTRDDWPATLPPFTRDALLASSDGRLLVRRPRTAASNATQYDVVDRRGVLVLQLTMPVNEFIVGFGAKSAYVVVTDDDGIQRIERHSWP